MPHPHISRRTKDPTSYSLMDADAALARPTYGRRPWTYVWHVSTPNRYENFRIEFISVSALENPYPLRRNPADKNIWFELETNNTQISVSKNYLGLSNDFYPNNLISSGKYVHQTTAHVSSHYIEYECFAELVLSITFGCMVCGPTYGHTYPINIDPDPISLRFNSKSTVSYALFQILNHSLSDLLRIRCDNMS
jgi:hypothetical protein